MSKLGLLGEVSAELDRARSKFAPFNSAHEGYAVLAEEVDELWQEVRGHRDRANVERMREEAIQIAAMALRFIGDVCDPVLPAKGET
jgi:hypothetical protein